ncbi:prefoldin subunit alpha [Thermococcus peptonophilus]|uniref:prefoldin subunit alpha n=1 Tax=Thermococcus peptonophilus TaxID=53952 RepID=UPI0006D18B88
MAEDTKKLEELAYQYQLLQAQAQLLAQNLELLTLGKNEFQAVKETLEGLKKEEGAVEILVPIGGAGSFLKGKILDAKNAIVSVGGAGYAVEKSLDDSIAYLEKRIKEYEEAIAKTQEALKKLEVQLGGDLAKKAQEIQQKQAMGFSVKK